MRGAPPAGALGAPLKVVPGEPQQLRWTKVKPSSGVQRPSLTLHSGRVVASSKEYVVAMSPDGDAAALRDKRGRVRVVQLLNGRASPFMKLPTKSDVFLAVSGFATVGWEAKTRTFHRVQSWAGRDQGHYPVPGKGDPIAVTVAPDARHAAVVSTPKADGADTAWKLCVRLIPLGVEGPERKTCWQGTTSGDDVSLMGVQAVFTDDGEHVWVLATSSWSISCGGGGEEVHAARIDVKSGAVTGRFDSETHKVEGSGQVGDEQIDEAVAVPGMDAVTAWHAATKASQPSGAIFWRFEWDGAQVVATTTIRRGHARPIRGGRTWVAVERGLVVTRAAGGGFIEDVTALPSDSLAGQRTTKVVLADDGRHLALNRVDGVLLWNIRRGRAIAWLVGARDAALARSRAMWRAKDGSLRTATWVQLEGLLPGLKDLPGGEGRGLDGVMARVSAAVMMLTGVAL